MPTLTHSEANFVNKFRDVLATTKALTLNEVIQSDFFPMKLIPMKCNVSEMSVVLCVMDIMLDFTSIMNSKCDFNDHQLETIARLIVTEHPNLSLQAIRTFFHRCKCGKFGSDYNRLDCPTLMRWLQQFEDEYDRTIDDMAYEEHLSHKADSSPRSCSADSDAVAMPEHIQKLFHIKNEKENEMRNRIVNKVITQNMHLYKEMEYDDAVREIDKLIQEELFNNGIVE